MESFGEFDACEELGIALMRDPRYKTLKMHDLLEL